MNRMQAVAAALAVIVLCPAGVAVAQDLYRNQMTGGLFWTARSTSEDFAADFGYNYSADGIPEAPNSRGGDQATMGVKLQANLAEPGELVVFTLAPLFTLFTGDYQLRFDAWMNYDADERINGSSAATTEFVGGGVGFDNDSNDVGAGAQIMITGDGGSGSDWRVFAEGQFLDAGEMAAGDRNGANAYYSDFLPGVPPPGGQAQTAFPAGFAGSPGFQWFTVEIRTVGGVATMHIEKPNGQRLRIATFNQDGQRPYISDGNFCLIYADYFSSVTTRPDLTFGLIDNVQVNRILFADGFESGDTSAWSLTGP